MSESDRMNPMSGEPVDIDGVYENEWGREVQLNRGEIFPADPQLGTTEWKLISFTNDRHTGWIPDPRYSDELDLKDKHTKHSRIYKGEQ